MKRFIVGLVGAVVVVGSLVALAADRVNIADPRTIGRWRGNEQAAVDIQKNFDALDAESVSAATAATTITRMTGSVSVVFVPQTITVTDKNDVVVTVWTGATATVVCMTNASAATTLTLTK